MANTDDSPAVEPIINQNTIETLELAVEMYRAAQELEKSNNEDEEGEYHMVVATDTLSEVLDMLLEFAERYEKINMIAMFDIDKSTNIYREGPEALN